MGASTTTWQIKKHYPQDWCGFLVGSGVKSTFKTGDAETPELLVKLFGQRRGINSDAEPARRHVEHAPRHTAYPRRRHRRLSRGEAISIIEPCPMPIKAFVPVYADTPFNAGLDPNPYYRGRG